MKATIGVYDNQEKAVAAIQELKTAGFPANQISLLGHAKDDEKTVADVETAEAENDDDVVFNKPMKIAAAGVGIGAVVGPVIGVLAGIGLLAIPGLGILVGAGAVAGAIAGLDAGIIGGGIISALAIANVNKHHEDKYHSALQGGRYLVVAQGTEDEVAHAKEVLHEHDQHEGLDVHDQ